MYHNIKIKAYTTLLVLCFSLLCASVYADNAALSIVPDTITYGSDQTLTILGSDTQFLGFGELLLPVTTIGFIGEDGVVITLPAEVLSDYAVHVAELSILKPGVYAIEVRNENQDAYQLTGISLTIILSEDVESGTEELAMQDNNDDVSLEIVVPEVLESGTEELKSEEVTEESAEGDEISEEVETGQSIKQLAIMYIMRIDAGPGGSIAPVPDESAGGFLFSIAPDEGYKIVDVIVDGESVGAVETYAFETVHANHSIAASFELIPAVEYCITATSGPGGSIVPDGVVCAPEGSSFEFVITADEGSVIADLLVDGAFVGAADTYAFNSVYDEHSITAFFASIPVVTSCITAVAGSGGDIIPSGEICSPGEDILFSIVPDEGYSVADVMVDGTFIGPVLEYLIAESAEDHMIFVSFVQQ